MSQPRDPLVDGIPFTDAEFEEMRAIFATMPTYRESDCSIGSVDVPAMYARWIWERSEEQLKWYTLYWETFFEGRAPFDVLKGIVGKMHSKEWVRQCIEYADKNGDGFIDREEFQVVYKVIQLSPDGGFEASWESFKEEIDTNEDGKLSIDEVVAWIEKKLA